MPDRQSRLSAFSSGLRLWLVQKVCCLRIQEEKLEEAPENERPVERVQDQEADPNEREYNKDIHKVDLLTKEGTDVSLHVPARQLEEDDSKKVLAVSEIHRHFLNFFARWDTVAVVILLLDGLPASQAIRYIILTLLSRHLPGAVFTKIHSLKFLPSNFNL
jgi:hypothetical protein